MSTVSKEGAVITGQYVNLHYTYILHTHVSLVDKII